MPVEHTVEHTVIAGPWLLRAPQQTLTHSSPPPPNLPSHPQAELALLAGSAGAVVRVCGWRRPRGWARPFYQEKSGGGGVGGCRCGQGNRKSNQNKILLCTDQIGRKLGGKLDKIKD